MLFQKDFSRYLLPAILLTLLVMVIQTAFLGVLIYGQTFGTANPTGVNLVTSGSSSEMIGGC